MSLTRVDERVGWSDPQRIRQLEIDADRVDEKFDKLLASVDQQVDGIRRAAGRNTTILIGILVSTTTASIVFALNLLAK